MASRPFAWEKSYPPGVRWDAPIRVTTLGTLVDEAAASFGERPAFEFRDQLISYAELGRRSDAFGGALLRAGLGRNDTVALYLPNTPYHPISFFGAAKAGIRLAHLSPLDAERVLAYKLKDAGARTLVTTDIAPLFGTALKLFDAGLIDRLIVTEDAAFGPSGIPTLPIPDKPGIVTFASFVGDAARPAVWPEVKPDDVALLQYTGGTTGMPKGAMLSHGNLTSAVSIYDAWQVALPTGDPAKDKIILVLPLFHIYALTSVMLRQLTRGSCLMLRMRFDPDQTFDDFEKRRATIFPGVPTMWIALVNHPRFATVDLSSLIYAASGGAPLPVEIARRFESRAGFRLTGGWGMTETSPAGTNVPNTGLSKPGTIGLPLPGLELDICALDDPHKVLPPGEIGEIRIRGPNVTRGYWNKPEESKASYADGWFLTGDIGFMDEDGFFFIVDRKKDMIISGGFNVYPQMIEQVVYEHPAVAEVIVLGVPDSYRGEAAKAFVTLREGAKPFTLEELQVFLKDKVGKHEMPAALEFRDSLPKTPVGKLSRAELRSEIKAAG
ncbi:MAG: dicarboxylate--CoA ligase PimA [Phreatobacter sp.]|uniref:dicarboxylate--CoA ligase PimA n=1 Tax=Phreatobacter sp. TaxID=1966341 RepID=UPI001A52DA7D|nr:dicarboxylate--CoA ligase PimA [Phreatobacter sp.]MBL8571598.1 dicarboxylate--CoA ligase PimA [Phreatobacter sp.]